MKAIVRIFVDAEPGSPGSSHEYQVDDADPSCGELVAQAITDAVDERPDRDGRLAELRRAIYKLGRSTMRSHLKPSGARSPGARVQYHPESRTTGYKVRVELRKLTDTGVPPNRDDY